MTVSPMTARTICVPVSKNRVGQGLRSETLLQGTSVRGAIDFALRWGAFDGDEYILPEFGVQPEEFYRGLLEILVDRRAPVLDPRVHNGLIALCRRKISVVRA
ncbi:hypothetical protein ACFYVR_26395 [Rhodococcus sp. NPDC003318]|uniref:hypothetical protein n=1 Tax=Rhodococcus sp. NPDC003318 TaxID=3364503 RepID=UPI003681FA18